MTKNEKKVKYSKPFISLYSQLKSSEIKRIQKMTESEVEDFIQEQNLLNRKHGTYSAMDIAVRNLRGEVEQIFIQDEKLLDFLEETEIKDLTEFKQLFDENEMCIIHLPNRDDSIAVWLEPMGHDSFGIKKEQKYELLFIQNGHSNLVLDINLFKAKNETVQIMGKENGSYKKDTRVNLVANTFAYMSAFPDMIKKGLPKGCVINKGASSKKFVLNTEPSLIVHGEKGVTPHLRRGHFRYLSSEVFTKKRGQWVFVKASFVGAKDVKTVE